MDILTVHEGRHVTYAAFQSLGVIRDLISAHDTAALLDYEAKASAGWVDYAGWEFG